MRGGLGRWWVLMGDKKDSFKDISDIIEDRRRMNEKI